MIWFTSDFHFWHKNVIRFDNRPFKDVYEMNSEIVKRWNEVVGEDDTVYYLGDLTFGSTGATKRLLYEMNGKIIWIKGNHDKPKVIRQLSDRFEGVYDYLALREEGIILFHYPITSWAGIHRGSILLYGHTHGNLQPIYNKDGKIITQKKLDVGCMNNNYYPISLDEVHQKLDGINNKAIDHHEE